MTIKPIRTDADHAAALARIDTLWDAEPGTPEADELEVLGLLVAHYEEAKFPIDAPEPIETLKFFMDQNGYTQKDLAQLIGGNRASEILHRRRALNVDMVWKITQAWRIPADLLVRPYRLTAA